MMLWETSLLDAEEVLDSSTISYVDDLFLFVLRVFGSVATVFLSCRKSCLPTLAAKNHVQRGCCGCFSPEKFLPQSRLVGVT